MYYNTGKYIPECIVFFNTCQYRTVNAEANTFTNMIPIQSNTYQYKLKYRPTQAPIQTNTHQCFQYVSQYMSMQTLVLSNQVLQPAQPAVALHPLTQVCQRYLALQRCTLQLQQNHRHPLVCRQTVPWCFVTAKVQADLAK